MSLSEKMCQKQKHLVKNCCSGQHRGETSINITTANKLFPPQLTVHVTAGQREREENTPAMDHGL